MYQTFGHSKLINILIFIIPERHIILVYYSSNFYLFFSFSKTNIITLTLAPWCNTVGILLTMLSLLRNDTVVFVNKFQEDLYLNCVQKYKVSFNFFYLWYLLYLFPSMLDWYSQVGLLLAVPPLIVMLGKSKILSNYDVSSVELIYCGGAPLDSEAMILFKKR